ncbi:MULTISPECIES: LacI family DNA-binding transcriptional regulator [Thermomonosporaceae]|uniref:LacI family DNA-binding transcriptional regulator n=1 Tax=Thermomonosporaceae TaxID=2012 RepID=UPI00255B2A31|nr:MULTISPECIES: LacI family DNA-binding transcriptional regulator [Thermomonosporaceae]MDL4774294.1 LacI family DNA-binding transcriptional regulator [Actinomadura xylanilytica]
MPHPTLEDVAARAGVSRALVSLVMRGSPKVGEERRAAVLAAARELGYRPNAMARGLAAGRTGIVGVLLADLHQPLYARIHDGLADEAARRDVRLLLTTGRGRPALERAAVEDLLDLRLDGLVLAGPRIAAADLDRAAAGCAITVVGRAVRSDRVDRVTGDAAAEAAQAVAHLTALGHRRIACLDLDGRSASLRRAFLAAMDGAGPSAHASVLTVPDALSTGPGGLPDALGNALDGGPGGPPGATGPPTAVLALGDPGGTAALAALLRAGRRVPEDVSLVVHGDPPGAGAAGVTTVGPDARELGRLAMGALMDRIRGGVPGGPAQRIGVAPVLTERATTAPPPAGA